MENKGNYYITNKGRAMIAEMIANKLTTLTITRVMVGSGKIPDEADPRTFTDLVAPFAEATTTEPLEVDDTVSLTVQYRNDMHGGLEDAQLINEFGIFARGTDDLEYLIFYGNLGDFPDSVTSYTDGRIDVREYPVKLVIADGVDVVIEYPAGAYLTYEQMVEYVRVKLLPLLMDEFRKLIAEHNAALDAHPALWAAIAKLQSEIDQLKAALNTNITKNLFNDGYADLDAYETFEGVWNKPKQAEF